MKQFAVTLSCALLIAACSFAQEAVIHENNVHPSMTDAYRSAVLKLKEACVTNKINMSWVTMVFDDNTFSHVLPVQGTASVETDIWVELKSKIGNVAFEKLVADLGPAIASSTLGTSVPMPQHSYLDPKPGEFYRMMLFVFPLPGKETELENLFLEWKRAFESSKTTENYHLYKITYGADRGYIVSLSAKNAADMEVKRNQTHQLMGDKEMELWKKQLSLTRKYFWRRGYFMPQLGYAYTAAN
jgi:hypothetical protein